MADPATFRVDPLPDFLADHTLLATDLPGRLLEHARRWTQVVRSLWAWHDAAAFALRFRAEPHRPTVLVTVDGVADIAARQPRLDADLEMRFRDFGVPVGRMAHPPTSLARLPDAAVVEVRQRVDATVWEAGKGRLAGLKYPPVVFPWAGPGGTFQFPVRVLLSLGVAAELTVHLRPVTLTSTEVGFLRDAAAEAEGKGRATLSTHDGKQQLSLADPAAALAAELYLSQYRRLANPFLVAVRCAAATAAHADALAASVRAVVLEPPLEPADPAASKLPAGADVEAVGNRPPFRDSGGLARLAYLADAAGAATVFRLPVSVNGGVPGIDTRQRTPDFHPGPRTAAAAADEIDLGRFDDGGRLVITRDALTQHALVTGFTGSGKTVTVLRLLHQLWAVPEPQRVPFLVLESAKQEYRGLFGVPALAADLRVFTLGNETCVPFRLNPFELLPGVRVEAHVGRLQVCFEAAMPPVGPSASVIAEALVATYAGCGWTFTDTAPAAPRRRFPTLTDFVAAVRTAIDGRKYEGDVKANVTAAIVGRLGPLLIGSKGRMFDGQRSTPPAEELFRWPTVLEMNDLNADDKALVVMFVLTLLREYRERAPRRPGRLEHLTVVEEAHNVLAATGSAGTGEGAGADLKFKAVEAFCALLTEVRALGEGLVIADQSPEKLARDAIRNTNLQVAHQLRDGHDREAVANAMIMTPEQRDFVGKLRAGRAAVFRTGLERATFVTVPPYYPIDGVTDPDAPLGVGFERSLPDAEVMRRMTGRAAERRPERPFASCEWCLRPCDYGDAMWPYMSTPGGEGDDTRYHEMLKDTAVTADEVWAFARAAGARAAEAVGVPPTDRNAWWCLLTHFHHYRRPPGIRTLPLAPRHHARLTGTGRPADTHKGRP